MIILMGLLMKKIKSLKGSLIIWKEIH